MAQEIRRSFFGRIRSSITAKLILAMILVALVPLLGAGLFINNSTAQQIRSQTAQSLQGSADATANAIAQLLTEQIRLLQGLSTAPDMRRQVELSNASYIGSQEDAIASVEQLDLEWRATEGQSDPLVRRVLTADPLQNSSSYLVRRFQEQFPNHVEVFTTDRYGALLGSTNKTSDYYQADEGWWQDAWANSGGAIHIGQPELDESTSTFAVNLAVPIRTDAGQVIGVLRSTVDIRIVVDILAQSKIFNSGRAEIVDLEKNFLFNPLAPETIGSPANLPAGLDISAAGTTETDDELIAFARPSNSRGISAFDSLPWVTITRVPLQEALAPVRTSNLVSLATGLSALVIASLVALLFSRALTSQIRSIQEVLNLIGIGRFDARVEVVSEDEVGEVALGLNAMLDNTVTLIQSREDRDRIQAGVMKLLDEVSGVADGDLTREAEVTSEITGAIADSFNLMIAELREIIGEVQQTTDGVSTAASDVRSDMEQLSGASEQQAQKILEASTTIDSLAQSARQVSQSAAGSAEVAERSVENARLGSSAVQETISGMQSIRGQVQETSKRIKRLGESSQEIGEIVQLIGDIAERTSMLALNASIQAAMAGPAGRGFAVVAEEVEQLSERATNSTKRIATLVKTIQAETNEAVTAMESTTREVVEGSQKANQAGQVLTDMTSVVDQLADLIQRISQDTQLQASSSEEVSAAISAISQATMGAASETGQAARTVGDLANQADQLRRSLGRFRLPQAATPSLPSPLTD